MKTTLDPMILLPPVSREPDINHALRDRESLKKSCRDFEALFLQSLFQSMRKTVPESELFEENTTTDFYRDMLDMEIATKIAHHQSTGLAEQMYTQMEQHLPPLK
ncbi:rod-binding protein [Desulfobulbus alkaliphilus]|uniref:rod-binding protein n=1 Tax=Desulfobulbus alkaliphilus TaxID=869814 RepID=UPI001963D582|nr:rod-binding protein [Desulfobulbus alkaliphilus]MBM9537407.1 rod-binding protein [Desulfobulbus alkaliphilus]